MGICRHFHKFLADVVILRDDGECDPGSVCRLASVFVCSNLCVPFIHDLLDFGIKHCCFSSVCFSLNTRVFKHAGCCINTYQVAALNSRQRSRWGRMGKRGPERDGDSLRVRVRAEEEVRCTVVAAGHLLGGLVARWSKRQLAGMALGAELPAEG